MKVDLNKEWLTKRAELDEGAEVGAGAALTEIKQILDAIGNLPAGEKLARRVKDCIPRAIDLTTDDLHQLREYVERASDGCPNCDPLNEK